MGALLRTKLHSPPVRQDLVSRQRLLDRLNAGLWSETDAAALSFARKLTLVSAPAGFGKTTLTAVWLAGVASTIASSPWTTNHCRSSWLSLEGADSDPERFLTYLIAALRSAAPDIGLEAQVVLGSGGLPALDDALVLLVNDIVSIAHPLILVLDDYHVIRSEAVDQLLAALLERQPPSFHLVIVSRADPPLPLSRLRVQRQMLEIRASDLRFGEEEAFSFLSDTMGLDLPARAVAALEQRTEGWIAGLQLAALSLQGRDDGEEFIAAFSGSNRYIIDYLMDEVLRHQPPEVRSFLVQTSILDYLCAPLCDAVLGCDGASEMGPGDPPLAPLPVAASPFHSTAPARATAPDSQAILGYLERTNLFLLPVDDQRRWYRYHHLFADSLRTELQPAQEALLHCRAARWYADNGHLARAIQHALAACDYELAAEFLGEAGHEATLWAGGDFRRYCDWVELLPDEVRRKHPRLQLVYARALQVTGRLDRAEEVLTDVAQALQAAPTENRDLSAIVAMYQALCLLERGQLTRGYELAQYAADHLSGSTPLNRARSQSSLACLEYGLGNFALATPRFRRVSQTSESPSLALNAAECAARGLLLQGKLRASQQLCEEILTSSRTGATYNHLAAGAFATLSEVHYHRDTFEQIVASGDQAIELAQRMAPQAPLRAHEIWVYLQYARLRQVQGDGSAAAEAIGMADQVAQDVHNTFYLELARTRDEIFRLGREYDIPSLLRVRPYPPVTFSYLEEYRGWAEALVLSAQHRAEDALAILDRLVDIAGRDGRDLSVIELQLSRALTLLTLRKTAAASTAVASAVALAAPEDCVRVFLDAGSVLFEPLAQVRAIDPDFVGQLLEAIGAASGQPASRARQSAHEKMPDGRQTTLNLQMESLSEREVQILRLLADGLSNQEIGDRLYIGVGTVKWYLTNLYGKLDVGSRTRAVARARELGVVP